MDIPAIEALGIKCVVAEPDPSCPEEPRYNSILLQDVLEKITKEAEPSPMYSD